MFGRRLKEARSAKNLSQLAFSRMLSVSQQTIASWESNRTSPPPEMVAQIASKLEVSADYLLGLSDTPGPSSPMPESYNADNGATVCGLPENKDLNGSPESEDIKEFIKGYAKLDKKGKHHVMSEFYKQLERAENAHIEALQAELAYKTGLAILAEGGQLPLTRKEAMKRKSNFDE